MARVMIWACRALIAPAACAADRRCVVDRAQHPRDVAQRKVGSRARRDRRERLTLEVQHVPPVAAAEHLTEVEVPVDALGCRRLPHGLRTRGECRNPAGVALELGKGGDRPAEPLPHGSGELARAVGAGLWGSDRQCPCERRVHPGDHLAELAREVSERLAPTGHRAGQLEPVARPWHECAHDAEVAGDVRGT